MGLFRNAVFTAAAAGLLAGLILAALQTYATVPLILQAETFENAGEAHDHGAAPTETTAEVAAAPAEADDVAFREEEAVFIESGLSPSTRGYREKSCRRQVSWLADLAPSPPSRSFASVASRKELPLTVAGAAAALGKGPAPHSLSVLSEPSTRGL